jgi:hypothetical protein
MGKASSAKKVARAARAGGNRRAGQRRNLGFPVVIGVILVLGLLLVFFARERRNADAFPKANVDHVHAAIDIYTCVVDTAASSGTTTTVPTASAAASSAPGDSSTTTSTSETTTSTSTPSSTPTTQAAPTDVHGEFQPAPQDATKDVLGIHTHGDGLMHIHPFKDSVAGRKATLGVFLDQVGISMTDSTLQLTGGTFKEGTTKCEGGKDGTLQVAKWDHASDAAKGNKPNQILKAGFDKIRLGADEAFTIAFLPDGSTVPAKPDVETRIKNVTDVAPSTTAPSSSSDVNANSSTGSSSASGDQSSSTTTSTTTAPASTSSSGP